MKDPKIKCRNCQNVYSGKFCNNCGQSASVKRFDLKYLMKESFISSLDIENGFFSTIKSLSIQPGKAIREYLKGKRLGLSIPVRYLIVMGTVATFLTIRYKVFTDYATGSTFFLFKWTEKGFWEYASEFTTVVNVLAIPVFAFFTWLLFKPKGYNFAENLILNIYVTAHQLFFLIALFPVIELLLPYKNLILSIYFFLTLLYNLWVYVSFYQLMNVIGLILSILVFALAYMGTVILNYATYQVLHKFDLIPHLKNIDF